MKRLIAAIFAVVFVSSAWAQDVPKPTPKPFVCVTIDAALSQMEAAGKVLPWKQITDPKYRGITVLAYADGSAVAVKTDAQGCIIASKLFFDPSLIKPKEMSL